MTALPPLADFWVGFSVWSMTHGLASSAARRRAGALSGTGTELVVTRRDSAGEYMRKAILESRNAEIRHQLYGAA